MSASFLGMQVFLGSSMRVWEQTTLDFSSQMMILSSSFVRFEHGVLVFHCSVSALLIIWQVMTGLISQELKV
jgi:hypothetical protein